MGIEIRRCTGDTVGEFLEAAARLRIAVFREFPYLYDGSEVYEQDYLRTYAASPGAVVVVALAGGEVVGLSTGLPLADADEAFRQPFARTGREPGEWFYFGESVLMPAWRGRGIGHRFFDEREAHAAALGFGRLTFCAVRRAQDHPRRPRDYRPHDVFWRKRGFVHRPELVARLGWQQVDGPEEVENELEFWTKE